MIRLSNTSMFDNDFFSLYCFCRALVCMQLVLAFFDMDFQESTPAFHMSLEKVLLTWKLLIVNVSDSRLGGMRQGHPKLDPEPHVPNAHATNPLESTFRHDITRPKQARYTTLFLAFTRLH